MTRLDWSRHPVVVAPMAGGPTTVELAVAAARGGAFPVLAGAYLAPERLRDDIASFRDGSPAPFGVNVFVPSPNPPSVAADVMAYAELLAPWAAAAGVDLGEARWDDDAYAAKVDVLVAAASPLVSFSFGWPSAEDVGRLHDVGTDVWCTVNQPEEADWAVELGADGLVAQGWEAGAHRGGPVDSGQEQPGTLDLVRALRSRTDLPVMAAGGFATGTDGATALAAGATAAAYGTAFLLCPEAGTSAVHRHALVHRRGTTVTRAYTGRSARALVTSWTELYGEAAPAAYPHVHHLTAPLRAHGRATGEAELVNLWAGTGHDRARELPAEELARTLLAELRD
ncbi:MAG TPA: nitronate monooxygenase [Pedococcus sp.]|nr:nitronate monooxygenase [Pedococcus sp.]